ncbi:hypothetical protein EX30DRAFT_341967 [Ascodesmis nigricans]|uniref:Uncharacterized protein n=1 Tax=Ascodesmis nigricans TaxID=341454 RepID=A0A4S2MTL5_9PEZI|nr:hypothetical protein EX30DRAFT_341967 [Ascodesmis nigricans]
MGTGAGGTLIIINPGTAHRHGHGHGDAQRHRGSLGTEKTYTDGDAFWGNKVIPCQAPATC